MNNVTMNAFSDHISKSWKQLRYQTGSSDVTLACENQQIKAHKLVLSAMSPVLKDLFVQNPHQYPLIYLKGVKFAELFSILDYMYYGEVSVPEKQLKDFLSTASELGIEDLSNIKAPEFSKKEKDEEHKSKSLLKVEENELNENLQMGFNDSKTEPFENVPINIKVNDKEMSVNHGDVLFKCNQCTYEAKEKYYLRRHIQAKHEGVLYPCEQCDYKAMYKQRLKTHVLSIHKGFRPRFQCQDCEYSTLEKVELKNHIESKHEGIRYPCSQCDFQFTVKKSLRRHILNIHNPKLDCELCGYSATEKKELKKHVKNEHKTTSYTCKQCSYQSPLRKSLRRHVQEVHNPNL